MPYLYSTGDEERLLEIVGDLERRVGRDWKARPLWYNPADIGEEPDEFELELRDDALSFFRDERFLQKPVNLLAIGEVLMKGQDLNYDYGEIGEGDRFDSAWKDRLVNAYTEFDFEKGIKSADESAAGMEIYFHEFEDAERTRKHARRNKKYEFKPLCQISERRSSLSGPLAYFVLVKKTPLEGDLRIIDRETSLIFKPGEKSKFSELHSGPFYTPEGNPDSFRKRAFDFTFNE